MRPNPYGHDPKKKMKLAKSRKIQLGVGLGVLAVGGIVAGVVVATRGEEKTVKEHGGFESRRISVHCIGVKRVQGARTRR